MRYAKMIGSLIIAAAPLLGAVKLQVLQGRPVVKGVFVNGHGPYRFLLDTGAQSNQIEAGLARSIGLLPTFQVEMVTAAGVARVSGGKGLDVSLDSVTANQQEFLYTDMQAVRQLSTDIQGVLGQAFLSRFDYLLDLRAKRLEFGPSDRQGTRVELRMLDGRPSVFSNLGWLVLDSGADRIILFDAASAKSAYTMRTATGFLSTGTIQTKPLVIEGRSIPHREAVAAPRQSGASEDGLLPASLFHAVYVNNSHGYVILD
ncbi:MAG TPA: retropepsin-like aspartic protease [Bryobacteraceae bacterium]|nr:retropepsin-like aspartic protease [Bryobacteraceae bacterium]